MLKCNNLPFCGPRSRMNGIQYMDYVTCVTVSVKEDLTYASDWYAQFPVGNFTTWDELHTAFLDSFCPIGYAEWAQDELSNVQLLPHETI